MRRELFLSAFLLALPAHAQSSAATGSYGPQGGATPSSVGLPSNRVTVLLVCDGATDNQPAIQAAVNSMQTLSPIGGVVQLSPCNNACSNETIAVTLSNIYIQGAGATGRTFNGSYNPAQYVSAAVANTVLAACTSTSLSTAPMISFNPPAAGHGIKGGGVSDLVLSGQGNALYGIAHYSTTQSKFTNLAIEGTTSDGFHSDITNNALATNDETDSQNNYFNQIYINELGSSSTTASCWGITNTAATNPGNFSLNFIGLVQCAHQQGNGITLGDSDHNVFSSFIEYVPNAQSNPGYTISIPAVSTALGYVARQNTFNMVQVSPPSAGVYSQGTEVAAFVPHNNSIKNLSQNGNAAINCAITNGTQCRIGIGSTLYWHNDYNYGNDNGVLPNMITNSDFSIDQTNGYSGAFTPSGNGNFIADMWRHFESGLGSALTYVIHQSFPLNVGNPGNGSHSYLSVAVAVQTAPAAGNYAHMSQNVETTEMRALGWGTTTAIDGRLSFDVYAPTVGNYSVSFSNNAGNQYLVQSFPVPTANVWTHESLIVPADATGTWATASGQLGVQIAFDWGAGTTFQTSTLNAWGATAVYEHTGDVQLVNQAVAAALYIANVNFSAGDNDPPHVAETWATALSRVQHYIISTFPFGIAAGQNKGVAGAHCVKNPIALGEPSLYWDFGQRMAKAPSVTTYNPSASNANWRDVTASADVTVSVDPATAIDTQGLQVTTTGTVATLGDILCIHAYLNAAP